MPRTFGRTCAWVVLTLAALPGAGWAVTPAPEEMADAREWAAARCAGTAMPVPVFSFRLGGRDAAEVMKAWKFDRSSAQIDEARTRHTL